MWLCILLCVIIFDFKIFINKYFISGDKLIKYYNLEEKYPKYLNKKMLIYLYSE
jgi:hypothetical protein